MVLQIVWMRGKTKEALAHCWGEKCLSHPVLVGVHDAVPMFWEHCILSVYSCVAICGSRIVEKMVVRSFSTHLAILPSVFLVKSVDPIGVPIFVKPSVTSPFSGIARTSVMLYLTASGIGELRRGCPIMFIRILFGEIPEHVL
eukprot:13336676-Ditylum_brightwellii.AAC.1